MIHRTRRLRATGFSNDLSRHARDGLVVRHRLEHDGTRGDPGAMTNLDVSENFRTRNYQYPMRILWMPTPRLFPGAAERYAVQHRNVVFDHRRLTDDETRSVIDEDAAPDLGIGMNVALEDCRGTALQIQGGIPPPLAP